LVAQGMESLCLVVTEVPEATVNVDCLQEVEPELNPTFNRFSIAMNVLFRTSVSLAIPDGESMRPG